MEPKLTVTELGVVKQYLRSDRSRRETQLGVAVLVSAAVAVSGLVLVAYATILFLHNPTDRVATFVLLPGGAAGLLLVMVGVGILGYSAWSRQRAQLASILRKLLAEDLPSQGC